MENEESQELIEARQNKLKELDKKFKRKGMWIGFKNFFIFLVLTFATLLFNIYLFNPVNYFFAFVCGMANGVFFMHSIKRDYLEVKKEVEEEVLKLFN